MRQRGCCLLNRIWPSSGSRVPMYYSPHRSSPPINSLPVELLSYIFQLGTHLSEHSDREDDRDECQPFNSDSVKAPLVYASVSWHWRRVVLSTPALFTSLCITPELLRQIGNEEVLDTTGISSYLALSRNCLVDILIDARDQEWDFEDDGGWFSAKHMSTAMGVLLPHLRRWRSLSILTDVWAPMHAALQLLEVDLREFGATHLESLRLMRCDAYAAHTALDPGHGHVFLSSVVSGGWKLANLRHLTLRGVPAAWTPLSTVLTDELQSLELSFHPLVTQPSIPQLAALLRAAPHLTRLVMNGSGPVLESDLEPPLAAWNPEPVALPLLTALTLGYTSAAAGLALLDLLEGGAPRLHTLMLEDATHPADTLPVDAGPLLARLFPPLPHTRPLFPALAQLALHRAHLVTPPPQGARVASLALVATHPLALALEASDSLCVRGPLTLPTLASSAVSSEAGLAATVAVLRALVETRGAKAPRVICVHDSYAGSAGGEEGVEEVFLGGTQMRVFRRLEAQCDEDEDEDTVMGSEPEYEDEAFKVGGVFNDPVFDARYGYLG
ncbi:hypothetical protein B0H12DRAFT_519992 [Mycena haematopus]|nr:hypothetical protein B0H12DRAFT_519992 [Mycena haematopus]